MTPTPAEEPRSDECAGCGCCHCPDDEDAQDCDGEHDCFADECECTAELESWYGICITCNGSGEGPADGTTCWACRPHAPPRLAYDDL